MLSTIQQAARLAKKYFFGVAETSTAKDFFEEAFIAPPSVRPSSILTDWSLVPTDGISVPQNITDAIANGILAKYTDLALTHIPNTHSFRHDSLKNAVPFNYGDGAYNYALKTNAGAPLPFGSGDWVLDTEGGILTFYDEGAWVAGVSEILPPKITFYRYTGRTGLPDAGNPNIDALETGIVAAFGGEARVDVGLTASFAAGARSIELFPDSVSYACIHIHIEGATLAQHGEIYIGLDKAKAAADLMYDMRPGTALCGSFAATVSGGAVSMSFALSEASTVRYNIFKVR